MAKFPEITDELVEQVALGVHNRHSEQLLALLPDAITVAWADMPNELRRRARINIRAGLEAGKKWCDSLSH